MSVSLDHIGAMVRDLEAGAARWRRLGFQLTRMSPQMGYTGPGGALELWASANHCAVFRQGYLELIGIYAPERRNPWTRFLDRFEGVHICAFRCDVADEAYAALTARGVEDMDPPVDRRRDAPYGEGVREMRFRNIFSRDGAGWPEGRYIVIEHQTPEVLWHEPVLDHPNGAVAFEAAIMCAEEAEGTARRIARLVDGEATETEPGLWAARVPGGGEVLVYTPRALARGFPGVEPPALPAMLGGRVAFADLDAAARLMRNAGVDLGLASDGRPFVRPADANGMLLAMTGAA